MEYRDILVHVDSTKAGGVRLSVAITLARRFDARLIGLHVVPDPDVPPVYKPSVVERVVEEYAEAARAAAEKTEALFRDRAGSLELVAEYRQAEGDIAEHLLQAARFADLLIIGQSDTETPPGTSPFLLAERVVFGCGSPVLVIPVPFAIREIGRSVLVGWDGSAEVARAIRDALPFLRQARTVTLVSIDPSRQGHVMGGAHASAMVAHLARHGVNAAAEEISFEGEGRHDSLVTRCRSGRRLDRNRGLWPPSAEGIDLWRDHAEGDRADGNSRLHGALAQPGRANATAALVNISEAPRRQEPSVSTRLPFAIQVGAQAVARSRGKVVAGADNLRSFPRGTPRQ